MFGFSGVSILKFCWIKDAVHCNIHLFFTHILTFEKLMAETVNYSLFMCVAKPSRFLEILTLLGSSAELWRVT